MIFTYNHVKLNRVVDGDTVDLNIDLGFGIYTRQRFRIGGINAPEPRGEERDAGLEASAFLVDMLEDAHSITIQTSKEKGKYGRYIADIFVGDGSGDLYNVAQLMVEAGHAIFQDY